MNKADATAAPEVIERLRLARGWRHTLAVCERAKRKKEGRPFLEIVKDTNLVRARESG